jgi:hypothetical protein
MKKLFIVVPTVDENDKDYEKYLKPSIPKHLLKNTYCIDNTKGNSMFAKYNYAIDYLTNKRKLDDEDMIAFIHSDITLLDQTFEAKLSLTFDYKTEVGIIGVYGSTQFNEQFGWWLNDRSKHARGHIQQGINGATFHMSDRIGYFDDMVVVDGCFLVVRGALAKTLQFRSDMDGYHQYENSYCIDTHLKTDYKVSVADILVQHESEGQMPEDWFTNGKKLFKEYSDIGLKFPLTVKSIKQFKTDDIGEAWNFGQTETSSPTMSA